MDNLNGNFNWLSCLANIEAKQYDIAWIPCMDYPLWEKFQNDFALTPSEFGALFYHIRIRDMIGSSSSSVVPVAPLAVPLANTITISPRNGVK
jgi:hypothetical protein